MQQKEELQKRAKNWLRSDDARNAIQEVLHEANKINLRLQEESYVDLKSLHEPFNV